MYRVQIDKFNFGMGCKAARGIASLRSRSTIDKLLPRPPLRCLLNLVVLPTHRKLPDSEASTKENTSLAIDQEAVMLWFRVPASLVHIATALELRGHCNAIDLKEIWLKNLCSSPYIKIYCSHLAPENLFLETQQKAPIWLRIAVNRHLRQGFWKRSHLCWTLPSPARGLSSLRFRCLVQELKASLVTKQT